MRRILAPLTLVLALTSCALLRPETPEDQARQRAVLVQIGEAAWRHARALALEIAGILTGEAVGASDASGRERLRATRAAASETSVDPVMLERVRAWRQPIPARDRVRLYTGPDGSLLVARPERGAAVLEDVDGIEIERLPVQVDSKPDFFPARAAGAHLLQRSDGALYVGTQQAAVGTWESYAGASGLVLGWWPCMPQGCPSSFLRPVGNAWAATPGPVEMFGADLALSPGASSTIAIATREGRLKTGWTLYHAEASPLLTEGRLVLTRPVETWAPARKTSLEDPLLVQGAPVPTLVGALYDLKADRPTGSIYLAELGDARLRKVLQVAATPASQEIGAAWYDDAIWLAVDTGAGTSGLYRYVDRRGMVLQATAPGGRPSAAAAEGRLWLSTSAGLYAMPP